MENFEELARKFNVRMQLEGVDLYSETEAEPDEDMRALVDVMWAFRPDRGGNSVNEIVTGLLDGVDAETLYLADDQQIPWKEVVWMRVAQEEGAPLLPELPTHFRVYALGHDPAQYDPYVPDPLVLVYTDDYNGDGKVAFEGRLSRWDAAEISIATQREEDNWYTCLSPGDYVMNRHWINVRERDGTIIPPVDSPSHPLNPAINNDAPRQKPVVEWREANQTRFPAGEYAVYVLDAYTLTAYKRDDTETLVFHFSLAIERDPRSYFKVSLPWLPNSKGGIRMFFRHMAGFGLDRDYFHNLDAAKDYAEQLTSGIIGRKARVRIKWDDWGARLDKVKPILPEGETTPIRTVKVVNHPERVEQQPHPDDWEPDYREDYDDDYY